MPVTDHLSDVRTLEACVERILPFRYGFGQWGHGEQRPDAWCLYNGRIRRGEHARVFPISNWTELDVWRYIAEEELEAPSICFEAPSICFAAERAVYRKRRGCL
jgi:sulfate adenylyltransferase subunit 2